MTKSWRRSPQRTPRQQAKFWRTCALPFSGSLAPIGRGYNQPVVAPVSWPNCDPDHTGAMFFVGACGEYPISAMRTASRPGRPARARPHFGAFSANCVQIGQVSVAPRTEAPRTGNPDIGPLIKEDREGVVPCSRNQSDRCLVLGIPRQWPLLCAFQAFIASNLKVAFGSRLCENAGVVRILMD